MMIKRDCQRIIDELDEQTSPHGVVLKPLDPDDSMVVVVDAARAVVKAG